MRCDTYPVCGSGRLSTNLPNFNRRMAGFTRMALAIAFAVKCNDYRSTAAARCPRMRKLGRIAAKGSL